MTRALSTTTARSPGWAIRCLTVAVCWALLWPAIDAQERDPAGESALSATGNAGLIVPGKSGFTVSFTLTPGGPRFALAPIAEALGVELRVGPKQEGHTLLFEDAKVLVGPDQALMVVVPASGPPERVPLSGLPLLDAQGLKVPLDFLEKTFGERFDYLFRWDRESRRLEITRTEARELDGSIHLVHQYGLSTVEVRFSKRPRFRVERPAGAVEIRLTGDRLRLPPQQRPFVADPLVPSIVATPDLVRIRLAANATAAEPRLLPGSDDSVSLIVEVFEATDDEQADDDEPRRVTRERTPGTLRTIVLDPGHGGEATGAVAASGLREADLALQVGRALKRQLERRLPVRVVLTRDADHELSHDSRTAIANEHQADLFISLHFNSSFGPWAHGAETYFLSREASDERAAAAAATENRTNGDADDPELELQWILWDLAQSYHLAESQRFANLVQEELNLAMGLRDRGVKQAPFRVLMGAQMPAVLVELGFLSNPEEEAKLQRPDYVKELVDALVRAVLRFKTQLEAREASLSAPPTPAPALPGGPAGESEGQRQ